MNKEKNNCLILAADTDDFFAQLLSRLEDDGLLDDTVILAYTDHYAYGFSDQELLKKYKKNEILYRVPAFIYAKEIPKAKVSKPMMTVDWLPTIANMFDLKASPLYIGNDIFDNENQGFVYFGDSSWLDSVMYSKEVDAAGSEENQEYIQKQNKRVKQSLEINDIVITGDYFSHK
jgi:phosphoglycerol transferase MdoB-like AlkP superfamily enzyme